MLIISHVVKRKVGDVVNFLNGVNAGHSTKQLDVSHRVLLLLIQNVTIVHLLRWALHEQWQSQ